MSIQYAKGPLGYGITKNGKPVGSIKDHRLHGGWLLKITGHSFEPVPGSLSHSMGVKSVPVKLFTELQAAMDAAEDILTEVEA